MRLISSFVSTWSWGGRRFPCSLHGYMVHLLIQRSSQQFLRRPCRLKCINLRESQGRTNDPVIFIQMFYKARSFTNDSFVFLECVIFPFAFNNPNLYSILGSKYHWRFYACFISLPNWSSLANFLFFIMWWGFCCLPVTIPCSVTESWGGVVPTLVIDHSNPRLCRLLLRSYYSHPSCPTLLPLDFPPRESLPPSLSADTVRRASTQDHPPT